MSDQPASRLKIKFRPAARKKASEHDDLVKLRNEITDHTDEALAKFGLTREQCQDVLMADLPANVEFEIRIDASGHGYYAYHYGSANPLGESEKQDYFFGLREFDLTTKTMKLHEIKVEGENLNNRAHGVKAMRNAIRFCMLADIPDIRFKAALGNGSYTWASLGMLPEYPLPAEFLKTLEERLSFLEWKQHRREDIPETALEALESLKLAIKMEKPEDLWTIADCRIPLEEIVDVKGLVEAETLFDKRYREKGMPPVFKGSIKDIYESGKTMTLGMYLLNSNTWESHFRIGENARQMARVEDYLVRKTGQGLSIRAPQLAVHDDRQKPSTQKPA